MSLSGVQGVLEVGFPACSNGSDYKGAQAEAPVWRITVSTVACF